MNFSMIRYVIGLVMLFESAFLSLPCLIALIYHEKKGFSFWIMLFVCLIIGILFVMKKPKKTVYYAKEGFLTVAISWIVMSFFGALPFVINGDIPSVVDAMFETVSGFILEEFYSLGRWYGCIRVCISGYAIGWWSEYSSDESRKSRTICWKTGS